MMPDFIDWQMDGGDLGSVTLVWQVIDGEPVFVGLELGRGIMEPKDAIDALWGVVKSWPGRTFADHEAAVKRWIAERGLDALEARASAADTAACEAYHIHSEQAA